MAIAAEHSSSHADLAALLGLKSLRRAPTPWPCQQCLVWGRGAGGGSPACTPLPQRFNSHCVHDPDGVALAAHIKVRDVLQTLCKPHILLHLL